jgi:asparagine synthase (glutamine-hydrolysing)
MRLRFLAAAGPAEPIEALARRLAGSGTPALQPILRAPELAVWAIKGTPHVAAPDGSAVAVGLLFEQADDRPVPHLFIPLPSPEEFLARFWGAYVLFALRPGNGHLVLRDPSGGVTAYHRRNGQLDIYASDLALLSLAVPGPLEPDLEFLRQWLTFPSLRGTLTGLQGVTELAPGTLRRSSGGNAQVSLAWSPWKVARRAGRIDGFEDAAALLRGTILRTVPRLADTGKAVLHLSGGLDSSIVAAALTHAGRPLHAVTFATRGPDGDERIHARAVARHLDCELAELVEEDAIPDIGYVPPPALRPPGNPLLQPLHRAFANHCALTGADLSVDGSGGDNVFCHLGSASPALDAFRRRGPRAGLAALEDLARLHGTTVWSVGRAAWRRSRKPLSAWPRDERFLAPGAAAPHRACHPWLDRPRSADRGTVEHVHSIVGIHYFHSDPAPGEVAALHPLLAQPILEACLRIPSWLWLRGGRDRAVARAAFRGLLPETTLSRRSKGHLASLLVAGYMATRPQLESLLLDGRLAAAGLLDRDAIREYLRRDSRPGDADYMRLLDLASAETWLRGFDS